MGLAFPDGRRFAFTIMDDTDVATVENVAPVYRLFEELGLRTTKTVWPLGCPEGSRDFRESETLEDPHYLTFVQELASRGFEIAYHGATMESSDRHRTQRGFARYKELFGGPPRVYANHAFNQENLYWGAGRLDQPLLRKLFARTEGTPEGYYQGHVPESRWWWGDLAKEISYVRNLTFSDINLDRVNPSMPYHDPNRPLVRTWFSASDAEGVREFNELINPEAQDRLEQEGGFCIVATHLGKGFARDGSVDGMTKSLLERLAARPGWFVPTGQLLDWLLATHHGNVTLPADEWRRMQWRWARDSAARRLRRLVQRG